MTRHGQQVVLSTASLGRRGRGQGEPAPRRVPPVLGLEQPLLLDSRGVALLLGIGRTKAYQLMFRREVPVVRIGRCVRVSRAALAAWIDEQSAADRSDRRRLAIGPL